MKEKFWRTSITKVEPGRIIIRGYRIEELMERCSFGDMVYLLFTGELPRGGEGEMVEMMLVSSVDHGLLAPSVDAARFVASSGVPLQAAVAAGIAAIGHIHGGSIEQCAKFLQEKLAGLENPDYRKMAEEIVEEHRREGKRVLGYGHPIHNPDPRTIKLLARAEELRIASKHTRLALELEKALKEITGRGLNLNVDGAMAAIISDMGIDWRLGKGFFIISRAVGLIAHSHEQMTKERPFKEIPLEEIEYLGPPERPVGG